jgi:hypothetical protein
VLQVINYLNTGLTLANGASSAAVASPAAASSAIASTVAASPFDSAALRASGEGHVTPVPSAPANKLSAVDMALSGSQPAMVQSSAASLAATTASTNEGTLAPVSGGGSPAGTTPLAASSLAGSGSGLRSSVPQARAVDVLLTGSTPDWLDA